MYLKRLDIFGFKSFATRTSFEFGQGITAIVGPNGSGKSNIADALRWVLGEQSGRLLRARKLEDAIFAGSSQRPPTDKAEITLTMDNADGWLPLDFSEVAIARRGYRSGESDYLLNRKRVRLRDVQELLAQANASQNSYAIIGQGLVETVLNLRPDERRQLIEEAADIQRYRLKIDEAEAKLAATHENVERVKLLIKEISPRLGQLERQAKRAAEHSRIALELAQALQAYYGHQWHHGHEALAVARAAHDQSQAEFAQAKVALDTCQRELDDVTNDLEKRREAEAAGGAERERLEQRLRDLEQGLALADQRRALLEARQRELQAELDAIQADQTRAAEATAADEGRRAELERGLAAAREELGRRQQELADLEHEYRGGHARVAEAEERSNRLQVSASDIKARLQRLAYTQRELEKDFGRLENRRRSLINQMAEAVRVLRGYRAHETELGGEVSGVGSRRDTLETEASELREALAKVEATQSVRRERLQALEARLEVLHEAQKQFQTPEPEATVRPEAVGAVAAVYEVLRVPRGLEVAIEAALAEYVEALIVQRRLDAVSAIQTLVAERAPRTTILPLDAVRQVYPLNLMRERGIVGVASRLVKCPPQYEPLVEALLGRTVIVQDTEFAVRLLRRGLGTIVTLDGIVFHPLGSITAGQPKVTRPYILGHERDLESIPKELERIRRSLALSEREAVSLRERLGGVEASLGGLTRDADESLAKRLRLQESIGERQQRLAALRGELRGLVASQTSVREQQAALRQESERLEEERDQHLKDAEGSRELANYIQKANAQLEERRQGLDRAVGEAGESVAQLDRELRSLAAQGEISQANLSRLEAQASAKAVQLQGLEMEVSALDSSAQSDREELAQAQERLRSFAATGEPHQETMRHLEARQRELHSQVLSSQSRLFEAERRVLESEAAVRRWQTEVETLHQHIEEDGLKITPEGDILTPEVIAPRIPYWLAAEGPEGGPTGPSGIQPISGGAIIDPEALGREIDRLRGQIRGLGPINIEAQVDYQQLRDRHDFLAGQLSDLEGAERSLHRAIDQLKEVMRKRFQATFAQVAEGFEQYFQAFFGGGHARLALSDPHAPHTSGVEIEAQPPGKRLQSLAQLSGGEKALTAVALLFALLQANPSPFCVLDEVDAMLDDANVGRFVSALKELSQRTQFIVITHARKTIEVADAIYGVSMGPDSASRVLSLRLADVTAN